MIDVDFDFTTDSPRYWDGFWKRNNGLGKGGSDPDASSPTLKSYHQLLWSRELPNGQKMVLEKGNSYNYLSWNDFRFGSDSIIATFRWRKNQKLIAQVFDKVGDYKTYYENILHASYTIGGMIIFPKHKASINQNRGRNGLISDRWDMTLECIRRYYNDEDSPLYQTLQSDKSFFDLFVDFQGYVDFFFLQDCVSTNYSSVNNWSGNFDFEKRGIPETIDEYFGYINNELEFLNKRNQRIKDYIERE